MKMFSPGLLIDQIIDCDPAAIPELAAELRAAIEYEQKSDPVGRLGLPLEIHLSRIVSLAVAAKLQNTSVSSLERNHSQHFVALGPGKRGMQIRDALLLDTPPRQPRVRAQSSLRRPQERREPNRRTVRARHVRRQHLQERAWRANEIRIGVPPPAPIGFPNRGVGSVGRDPFDGSRPSERSEAVLYNNFAYIAREDAHVKSGRRRRPHARRHHLAPLRAVTGARLYLRGDVPTQRQAADAAGSNMRYVVAAIAILQAEDLDLLNKVLNGEISILAAAKLVRQRASLLAAYRTATPQDRIIVIKTLTPTVVFDEAIAPALVGQGA